MVRDLVPIAAPLRRCFFLAVQMFAEPQTAAARPSQANNPKEESEQTVYLEQTVLTHTHTYIHTHTHTRIPHTRKDQGPRMWARGERRSVREPQNLCLGPAAAIEKSLAKRQTTHGIWPKGCGWYSYCSLGSLQSLESLEYYGYGCGILALQLCGVATEGDRRKIEPSNRLNS